MTSFFKAINDIPLKHTWRISRSAWYFRFFMWLWETKESELTTCKIFWGYIGAFLGLPLRLLIEVIIIFSAVLGAIRTGLRWLFRKLAPPPTFEELEARRLKQKAQREKKEARKKRREELGPTLMARVLMAIVHSAAWVAFRIHGAVFAVKDAGAPYAVPPVKYAARGLWWAITMITRGVGYSALGLADGLGWVMEELLEHVVEPLHKPFTILAGLAGVVIMAAALPAMIFVVAVGGVVAAGAGMYRLTKISERTANLLSWGAIGASVLVPVIAFLVIVALKGQVVNTLIYSAMSIGVIVATLGIAYVFIWLWMKFLGAFLERYFPRLFRWLFLSTRPIGHAGLYAGKYAGRGIQKTGLSFLQIMWIGFKAVKSNTCPKIEIVD